MRQTCTFHDEFAFGIIPYIVPDNYLSVPFFHPDQLAELMEMQRVILSPDESKYEDRTKLNIVQKFYLATVNRIAKIETVKKPAGATSSK